MQSYQKDSEESMRGSEVIIDRKGRWYIDSPKWLKNKTTTNPKNDEDNCFQYVLTVPLNYHNIKKGP